MTENAVRLQKFLAECGVASRRASEGLIEAGRVAVNGVTARVGQTVTPGVDRVTLDGAAVGETEEKVYLLLNKPLNCVTTARDTHGRRTVLECVRGLTSRVFPVGRLDFDVEGALLLTNDGELAFRLTHPRFEVEKVYLAWVLGAVTPEAARRLEAGVRLEDGMTSPAKVAVLNGGPKTSLIRLTIHEGRKHEVKRMCAAV
ncbi:MAG TPA: pseudouridine synthase, partial [Candidatus Hydrogenedentes bacterium]|nr:pseudouridine synthase [Candidatus Hydrogenedentota bacterium]